jgi:hypothetical protein
MAGTIVKLQTNIPTTGVVTYCDFIPTKNPQYSDQIALRGVWDGAGEGRIYLPLALESDFQTIGLIGQRTANGNYPLLMQSPRIKLLRIEISTPKGPSKRTTVEILSGTPVPQGPATTPPALYGSGTATSPPLTPLHPSPVTVEDLEETLEDCLASSKKIWEAAGGDVGKHADAIAASAHTLFISRCQRGMYEKAPVEGVPFE